MTRGESRADLLGWLRTGLDPLDPPALREARARLRAYVADQVIAAAVDAEREQRFFEGLVPWLGAEGFLAIGAGKADGGSGAGRAGEVMVIQELSRAGGWASMGVVPMFIVRTALWEFGDERLLDEVGRPMIRGERVVGIALSEPGAGSDVSSIRTRAVAGPDGYRLTGEKMFITNGSTADDLLVVAQSRQDSRTNSTFGMFLVETTQAGFQARPLNKECSRGSDTAQVNLDSCLVPHHRVVGNAVGGFKQAMHVLNGERILSCARALEFARLALELVLDGAQDRFDNGMPVLAQQFLQGPLADLASRLWMSRVALRDAVEAWDEGQDVALQTAMLKAVVPSLAVSATRLAQQALGPTGLERDGLVARYARDARLGPVGAGSDQVQHRIIARMLGLPEALE